MRSLSRPDDLAERHKVQLTPAGNAASGSGAGSSQPSKDLTGGLAGSNIIGVSKTAGGVSRDANGRFVGTNKPKTVKSGAANFAGQTVGALLRAANLPGVRRVIGGGI
ncbi:MAG: hypothetical protein HC933_05055 [Pleurocapsa sp. SU_196_0]|nr:hypothetical protein [Pleurocapsa sp. SU_196_0]